MVQTSHTYRVYNEACRFKLYLKQELKLIYTTVTGGSMKNHPTLRILIVMKQNNDNRVNKGSLLLVFININKWCIFTTSMQYQLTLGLNFLFFFGGGGVNPPSP